MLLSRLSVVAAAVATILCSPLSNTGNPKSRKLCSDSLARVQTSACDAATSMARQDRSHCGKDLLPSTVAALISQKSKEVKCSEERTQAVSQIEIALEVLVTVSKLMQVLIDVGWLPKCWGKYCNRPGEASGETLNSTSFNRVGDTTQVLHQEYFSSPLGALRMLESFEMRSLFEEIPYWMLQDSMKQVGEYLYLDDFNITIKDPLIVFADYRNTSTQLYTTSGDANDAIMSFRNFISKKGNLCALRSSINILEEYENL